MVGESRRHSSPSQEELWKVGELLRVSPFTVTLLLSASVEREQRAGRSAGFSDSLGYTRCCVHSLQLPPSPRSTGARGGEDHKPVGLFSVYPSVYTKHLLKNTQLTYIRNVFLHKETQPKEIMEVNYDFFFWGGVLTGGV